MGVGPHVRNEQAGDVSIRRSHYVKQDNREWGDLPAETYLTALSHYAQTKPDAIFLDFEGRTVTYAALERNSTRMANALAKLGIAKGHTVATILDNGEDAVTCFFAVNKLGAIWVPINTAYSGEFLRHQLADAAVSLAVCDNHYLGNLLDIAGQLPDLRQVLVSGGDWEGGATTVALASLERYRGDDDSHISETTPSSPGDIACLIYTSGTMGPSKGCMISYNCLCSIARRRNRSVVPAEGGVTWTCLPLFHIAAISPILIANLLAGERVAIARHFSVSGFWDEIERSGATSALLLASMLPLLAHAPDNPAMLRCRGQLRVVTGVPLSAADRKVWEERFGVGFMNTYAYGQTEANMISYLPWGEPPPPFGSMGLPADEFEVMVTDDNGRPVPIGEAGELVVRPRQPGVMFSGYWRRPQETLEQMKDMWWHTGDLVRMDENHFLYFVDRKKDYLRSRGENISSFEVETALMKHPAIHEIACHAVDNGPGLEEDIKITVVLKAGATASERDIFDWALKGLPYFAVPRFVEFRAALPKTPTGRVQKQLLRAEGKTATTWDATEAGLTVRRPRPKGTERPRPD